MLTIWWRNFIHLCVYFMKPMLLSLGLLANGIRGVINLRLFRRLWDILEAFGFYPLDRDDISFSLIDSVSQVVTFSMNKRHLAWVCWAIYVSPMHLNRVGLWEHLLNISKQITNPWVAIRDYNEILFSTEVIGGTFNTSRAMEFASMLDGTGLLDFHTLGILFTWRKMLWMEGMLGRGLTVV